jgi:hypothetical protein
MRVAGTTRNGRSSLGVTDIAGNVREGAADWYYPEYDAGAPWSVGPTTMRHRVEHGWRGKLVRQEHPNITPVEGNPACYDDSTTGTSVIELPWSFN